MQALPCPFHHELPEVGVLIHAGGDRELRQQDLAKLEVCADTVRDQERVLRGARVPVGGEQFVHLTCCLDVELFTREPESILVALVRTRLDTQQNVVGLGFMGFFTKAVTAALELYPAVNAMIDGISDQMRQWIAQSFNNIFIQLNILTSYF